MTGEGRVELQIRDERADMPGVIVPLGRLLHRVVELRPGLASGRWEVSPGARGYGRHIIELEEHAVSGPVEVDGDELIPILVSEVEYLEHGGLRAVADEPIEVGIWDSTFLYARCLPRLAVELAASFERTTVRSCDP